MPHSSEASLSLRVAACRVVIEGPLSEALPLLQLVREVVTASDSASASGSWIVGSLRGNLDGPYCPPASSVLASRGPQSLAREAQGSGPSFLAEPGRQPLRPRPCCQRQARGQGLCLPATPLLKH